MIGKTIALSMIMSLSSDFKRNSYLATVNDDNCVVESNGSQRNYFDEFSSIDNIARINNRLHQFLNSNVISLEVYNNAYNVISSLSELVLDKIDLDNTYISQYKTIMIDFEFGEDNIFSLEIGKDSIGYFSEVDSSTIAFCNELKTCNDDLFIKNNNQLSIDIEYFLQRVKVI